MASDPLRDPSGTVFAHRLRDLDARSRWIAAALVALLLVPFAFSAGRALADGWVPSGDEAVIAVRVHDALTRDPPLTGLPSTSDLYGEHIKTRHLGPAEFYLLAIPVRVLGPSTGMLVGAGAINAAAVLLAAWVILRRAGPGVALGATVLLGLTLWSTGSAVLTDPISSNIGGFPLLAAAVLAWALALGDHRLLPLAVGVVSFVAQQHLAMVAAAGIVAAFAAVGLAWAWWSARRTSPNTDHLPNAAVGDPPVRRAGSVIWPWVAGSVAVAAVIWLPVLVDQFTGDPGNLTAVARFAQDSDRATLGPRRGITQVLRAAGLPPFQTRYDVSGFDVAAPLNPLGVAAGLVVLAAVVAVAIRFRRRRPPLALLAFTALVMAVAGFVSGSSVPRSIEADRINLYRWTWVLALCAWTSLAWAFALVVRDRLPASNDRRWRLVPLVSVVALAGIVGASVATVGEDDLRRDVEAFPIEPRLGADVEAAATDPGPVLVVADGVMASLSIAPAVIADLVDDGRAVQVDPDSVDAYGDQRAFDPATVGDIFVLSSTYGPLGEKPGRELRREFTNARIAPLVDRLFTQARSAPVRRSAKAAALLAALPAKEAELVEATIDGLAKDPTAALNYAPTIHVLLAGYLDSPRFVPRDLRAMERAIPQQRIVWGQDRVSVRRLTLDELRAFRPDLFS